MFLDRTNSKIGQQFLYKKLRTIPKSANIKNEENIIDLFLTDVDFRISAQKKLLELQHLDAYYITTLFQDEHIKAPKWFFVTKILSFACLISIILTPIIRHFIFVFFGVFIINMIIHYWNKRNLYQYLVSIPQLLRLINVANKLFSIDRFKVLKPKLQISLQNISSIKKKMSLFRMEATMQDDYLAFVWGFIEIFKILFLLEPLFLFSVLKKLETKRKEIEDIYEFVGEIDSLISIASLRKGIVNYCNPVIVEKSKSIVSDALYHPLIFNCIENSINISNKSVLLTGSNMSGKTSFIRSIGINVVTGLTINTCFAKQFSMPRMRVFSAIRISDDLMNDKSYYFEEVITIKEMIDKSEDEKSNLFLLDEIFKGTNTIERISAGKAVLSSLAKGNNLVFVSTHDIELADLLCDEFDLYHFSEKVDKKTVDFDYKLKNGKLKTRNAIKILQINNYPEKIINEAIELSKELDKITVANN